MLRWALPVAVAALLAVAQPTAAIADPAGAATPTDTSTTSAATPAPVATSAPAATATPAAPEAPTSTAAPSARTATSTPASTPSPSATPTPTTSANGALGATIAQIALSQVGRGDNPVETDFDGLNCNPYSTMVAGFSSNENGCGYDTTFGVRNSNENWCADFVKWVWEHAGITQDLNTLNAAASSFVQWGLDDGQTPASESGTPAVGDAVVFFPAGAISPDRGADHVGIIVAVNADGTVDMVNGDFGSATNIKVEHDVDLNLTTFANNVWGAGTVWTLIAPPKGAQAAAPQASIAGPDTAVTGTEARFHSGARVAGARITGYYWMFGDGRTTNSTGRDVTHTFSTPGMHTITVTVTSSTGATTTVTKNVDVVGAATSVAAVPNIQTFYSSYPVSYYRFAQTGSALVADTWDGEGWLRQPVVGTPAATGTIASLAYMDDDNQSAITPHAFYRAADGSLAQSYLGANGWVSADLPGTPAPGADIVAAYTSTGPAVYFVDAAGHLNVTSEASGTWTTRTLSNFAVHASPLAVAETADGPTLFSIDRDGALTETSQADRWWSNVQHGLRVARNATIAAFTTTDGSASVVVDNAGARHDGGLVQLTRRWHGQWSATALPGRAAAGAIVASTYELPSAVTGALGDFPSPPGTLAEGVAHPLGTVVAYLGTNGSPAVTYNDGRRWQTAGLPGTATAVTGIAAEPVAHQPLQVYYDTASGPAMDTTGDTAAPSGPWTAQSLPATAATFPDRVLLYAAGSGDLPAAQAAATAAGLPASQVTTSYQAAWAATISGDYFVIAVGQAAVNALEYNVCGWSNPTAAGAGGTPFDYVNRALNVLLPADLFMNGAAANAANTQQRAIDMAYYAVHGALPVGQTALPAAGYAQYTCIGSAN